MVETGTGGASAALAWLSVLLSFTCTIGSGMVILWIQVLSRLADQG